MRQAQRALQRVKLFDWSVKDNIERDNRFTRTDFAAIISQPTLKNQWYQNMMEEYKEATEILSSYDYPFVIYEKDDNSWKKKLQRLLQEGLGQIIWLL